MYTFHSSNIYRLKSNFINVGIDFLINVVGNLRAGKTYIRVSVILTFQGNAIKIYIYDRSFDK